MRSRPCTRASTRGPLAPFLRRDLPFVPHVTVAAGDLAACERLAAELDGPGLAIRGALRRVHVVEVGASVRTIAELALAGPVPEPAR